MVGKRNKKIKVLRIINRFNIGGPSFNAAYLSRYLPEEFETKIIGGHPDKGEASSIFLFENLGLEPVIVNNMHRSLSLLNDYKAYKEIRHIIKTYQPDIVHTHASKAGFLGRMAAKREAVPVIFHTFHGNIFKGYYGKLKTNFFISLERYLARLSTKIIAISPSQKEELAKKYNITDESKIEIIPLGLDLNKFNQDKPNKRKKFREKYTLNEEVAIGIIGRLAPIKNHFLFVDAIAELKNNSKAPVRAFIIGNGTEKNNIIKHIEELGLTYTEMEHKKADFIFTSWEKNIENVLSGLDIVALTSINEGTPLSLIEAQAASVPIVATNAGGTKDVVIDKKTGFITSYNKSEIAARLLELVENRTKRLEMGKAGKMNVENKFDYSHLVNNTFQLYKKFI